MEHLNSISTVVFLKVSLDVLKNRISNFKKRGLAKAIDQSFEDLFLERQPLYEKYAEIEIDCNSRSQERAAELIADKLKVS